MGNIAPPLAKPFFSLGGESNTQFHNIQGDSVDDARAAQRQESSMQDDCRLGLAKIQQRMQLTETARIVTSNDSGIDLRKIETIPAPELITKPEAGCKCFNSHRIVWGGSWLGSDSAQFPSGIPAGWSAWLAGAWTTNVPQSQIRDWDQLSISSAYPYVSSLFLEIWSGGFDQRGFTAREISRCSYDIVIDPSLGYALIHKWLKWDGSSMYDITDEPKDYGGGQQYMNFIVAVNDKFAAECGEDGYSGPFYDFGWKRFKPHLRTTQSPFFLYCDGEPIGGIPVSDRLFP